MGSLFSKFWFRKEKTSLELLETLQEEIETIEYNKHTTVIKQKKYVGTLIIYSVCVYLLFALAFYFLAFPSTLRDGALYTAPLFIMPVIFFVAQKCIKWYFARKITLNTEKLADLRAKKKKVLDEVMDKETFRVAREILEKFAPEQLRKSESKQLKASPAKLTLSKENLIKEEEKVEETDIKKEFVKKVVETTHVSSPVEQPRSYPYTFSAQSSYPYQPPPLSTPVSPSSQKRRLARPILDPVGSRGFLDRLLEHLVGDGPVNRYALICSHCSSHNGMALREEFEYISFRCAYCGYPNPSRKLMSRRSSSPATREDSYSNLPTDSGDKSEENNETEPLTEETGDEGENEPESGKEDGYTASEKID